MPRAPFDQTMQEEVTHRRDGRVRDGFEHGEYDRVVFWMRLEVLMLSDGVTDLGSFVEGFIP